MRARVAFVTAVVSGVVMIAASVHGLVGIDRQLEHSAQAAQHTPVPHFVRGPDCPRATQRV